MDFEIRPLQADRPADFDRMLSLFAEVFDDPASYLQATPAPAYRRQLLSHPSFIALLATRGDSVIGALAAYELPKFEQARSEIYIYDLAVAEAERRRGVATALIEHLRGIARQRGAWVIYVQADTGAEDAAAIALYSRLGRREEVLHFDIPV